MSRMIVARVASTCLSTIVISFGSARMKLQLIGSPAPFSSGTSQICASLIRSWIISSVSSSGSFDPEAVSPCDDGGPPHPNEKTTSRANPKNVARTLVACIADLHSAYVQAREKQHKTGE